MVNSVFFFIVIADFNLIKVCLEVLEKLSRVGLHIYMTAMSAYYYTPAARKSLQRGARRARCRCPDKPCRKLAARCPGPRRCASPPRESWNRALKSSALRPRRRLRHCRGSLSDSLFPVCHFRFHYYIIINKELPELLYNTKDLFTLPSKKSNITCR